MKHLFLAKNLIALAGDLVKSYTGSAPDIDSLIDQHLHQLGIDSLMSWEWEDDGDFSAIDDPLWVCYLYFKHPSKRPDADLAYCFDQLSGGQNPNSGVVDLSSGDPVFKKLEFDKGHRRIYCYIKDDLIYRDRQPAHPSA